MNRRAMLANAILPGAAALPFTLVAVDTLGRRERDRLQASPDADLIALCEAHPALIEAVNADDGDCGDDDPVWAAYVASRDAISEAKPQTTAGMRAKALAAKAEARTPDGSELPESTRGGVWAWDILHDLLRLSGGEV